MSTDTAPPTVTEVRTALVCKSEDFCDRRRAHHKAMHDIPAETRVKNPHFDALFDAYESAATSGCFALTLAAVLRMLATRHPETADKVAALVREVMENGDDCLDGANDDIWALIEREAEAKADAEIAEIAAADSELPTLAEIEAGR